MQKQYSSAAPFGNEAMTRSKGYGASLFRGVWFRKGGRGTKRWAAEIRLSTGQKLRIGMFRTEIEAAMAYDAEAVRRNGSASITNFVLTPIWGRVKLNA